jgi:hypothetical protein
MIIELLSVVVPSILGMGAMVLVVRSFVNKESETNRLQVSKDMEEFRNKLQLKNKEITLPIRIQAYERMILFCSRIELGGLLQRLEHIPSKVKELKGLLIGTIEEEFSHNVTQQMYMSEELWSAVLLAKFEAISIIKMVANEIEEEQDSLELLKGLAAQTERQAQVGYIQAQTSIKREVTMLF